MTQPDISIIIPLYNREAYLAECLNSIRQQTVQNIEVLIIDDGSTDRSPEIAHEYCLKDSRFRLYKQKNQGASDARNTGLKHATGKYIQFLDSDDHLFAYGIQYLLDAAMLHDADTVSGNVICFDNDNNKNYRLYRPYYYTGIDDVVTSGTDYLLRGTQTGCLTVMIYNYLYRRAYLEENQLLLDTQVTHEDELWTPVALVSSQKHVATRICHYFYRQHAASITGEKNLLRFEKDMQYTRKKLLEFAEGYQGADKDKVTEAIEARLVLMQQYLRANLPGYKE